MLKRRELLDACGYRYGSRRSRQNDAYTEFRVVKESGGITQHRFLRIEFQAKNYFHRYTGARGSAMRVRRKSGRYHCLVIDAAEVLCLRLLRLFEPLLGAPILSLSTKSICPALILLWLRAAAKSGLSLKVMAGYGHVEFRLRPAKRL